MKKIKLFWKWTKIKSSSSDLSKESNSYSKSALKFKILKQVQDDIPSFSRHAEFISASIQSTPRHAELGSASPKKLQHGRSMIEMIGVLAIIGVISIGGVWGLNKAMTKNTANNIIEDVKLAGFIVVSELFDTLPDDENGLNMAGKFAQNTPYTFKAFPEGETTFEIFVPDISYSVCMELKQRKVDWLEELRANGKENVCKKDVMNEMSFFFNTELGNYPELTDNTCRADRDCPTARPYCRYGICSKCEEGVQLNNGTCTDCPTGNSTVITQYCHMCGNNFFMSTSNRCSECGVNAKVVTNKEECERCPNRCWDEESRQCILTKKGNAFNNNGICNFDCPSGQLLKWWTDGVYACTTCDNPNASNPWISWTSSEQCHKCGDFFLSSNTYKACSPCNTNAMGIPTMSTKEECDTCPNRCWDANQERCWLTREGNAFNNNGICNYNCPTGQLVRWSFANSGSGLFECVNCPAAKQYITFTSEEYCHMCPNTIQGGGYYCADCAITNTHYEKVSQEECKRCSNRYFNETDQKCYLCPSGKKASEDGLSCVDG